MKVEENHDLVTFRGKKLSSANTGHLRKNGRQLDMRNSILHQIPHSKKPSEQIFFGQKFHGPVPSHNLWACKMLHKILGFVFDRNAHKFQIFKANPVLQIM